MSFNQPTISDYTLIVGLGLMVRLSSLFPLVHSNGAQWNEISIYCNICGVTVPDVDFYGEVQKFKETFVIEGYGLCRSCDHVSHTHLRLHDDMSFTGRSPVDGRWTRWGGPKLKWWQKLLAYLFPPLE